LPLNSQSHKFPLAIVEFDLPTLAICLCSSRKLEAYATGSIGHAGVI
jgi:hypothetical protein